MHTRRDVHTVAILALLLALLFAPGASRADDGPGQVIEAPGNIRAFSPEETGVHVDAATVDLAAIMSDLGPDARLWYQHVLTLSNPFFEGRSGGTRGFELALEYIEFWFREYRLAPAFPDDPDDPDDPEAAAREWTSYRQPFEYRSAPRRSYKLVDAHLELAGTERVHGTDYAVLAPSGGERVTAPITFVGYGIDAGEDGYTSFDDDTDLTGRIAFLLRYEPLDEEGRSRWSDDRFSRLSGLSRKFRSVLDRGPAGIVLVSPPGAIDGRTDLETLDTSGSFGSSFEVPVVQLTAELAGELLRAADPDGRGLDAWRRLADEGAVTSVDLSGDVHLTIGGVVETTVEPGGAPSANVGGVLRGRGALADEWIVVGGHCDHVGYGGRRGGDVVHPGADDNASGTAGVLVLARRLAEHYATTPERDVRSILFLAFGAEEVGLRGSAHWIDHPTVDPDAISLMINMDMIGRLRSSTVMVGGSGTAEEFDEMLPRYAEASGLTLALSPPGRGPSDHQNFYTADVPVLFFFTGMHDAYHRPGDHGWTVNPRGASRIIDAAYDIALEVATREAPLTFRSTGGRRGL